MNMQQEFELYRFRTNLKEQAEQLPSEKRVDFLLDVIQRMHKDFIDYQKGVAELYRKLSGI